MGRSPRGVVAVIVALALVAGCGDEEPASETSGASGTPSATASPTPERERVTPKPIPPAEWVVAEGGGTILTFDGAPGAGTLKRVGRALEATDAPATFFLPGRWIAGHRDEVEALVEGGHSLGNRGYETKAFTKMTRRAASWSIRRTHALLERLEAEAAPFFRFPKGRRDERTVGIVGRQGYRSVRWTINPGAGGAGAIAEQVRGELRPGAILSLDLWRRSHVRALPKILKALRGKLLRPRSIEVLSDSRAIRWDREITPGWKGDIVTYIQDRLNAATYPAGAADGKFSTNTLHAVYAFEKVHGLDLDGRLSPEEMELLALAGPPPPPRDQSGRYIDIDIARQVLFEVEDGTVVNTYPISSASGATYVSDGETRIASTPRGDFAIDRKIPGWRVSDLGELYYPSYFYGGYAIHGSYSVPTYPASHGCIRIPMHVAADFYARNAIGTPVYVHD